MREIAPTDLYENSLESSRLKNLNDFDISNLSKIVTNQITAMRKKANNPDEPFKIHQFNGYLFEWEMWQFFNQLEPDLICNPDFEEPFRFDLSKYKKAVELKGDSWKVVSRSKTKQMDVVAFYGKHAFIIECKHTEKQSSSSDLGAQIDEFAIRSHFISKRLNDLFDGVIPVPIMCTSNYILDDADQINSLKNQGIIILGENERQYISTVLKGEKDKKTGKFKGGSGNAEFTVSQFLGYFRANQPDYNKKNNEKWRIPAFHSLSGPNKKDKVYTFSISPNDMLKISTVAHQKLKNAFQVTQASSRYYQRVLSKERLSSLGEHLIDTKQPYPNNILVSYRGEGLNFKANEEFDVEGMESNTGNIPGTIEFDACPGSFHVIDGQHRLFGYAALPKDQGIRETHRLIVTAFDGLSVGEEADIFLEVNSKAQPIKADLLMEIEWASQVETAKNIRNGITLQLRDDEGSCLYDKILQAESKAQGRLNPTNFRNGLSLSIFPDKNIRNGRFWDSNLKKTVQHGYEFLNGILEKLKEHNLDRWVKTRGLLQDIIMNGVLLVVDRAVSSYGQNKAAEIINLLSKEFSEESDERKDEILQIKKFFGTVGAGAPPNVAAFFVDQYLKPSYPKLVRDSDEEKLKLVGRGDLFEALLRTEKEVERLRSQLILQENKNYNNIDELSINKRATAYCNIMKSIVFCALADDKHYTASFWDWLIYPAFYNDGNVWDSVEKRWRKEKKESGANAYTHPFNHVEGAPLRQLLSDFKAYSKAKPPKDDLISPDERKDNTLRYIWENLLIPPQEKKLGNKINLDPTVWKEGVEYLALFERCRNYGGKKDMTATHAPLIGETGDPTKEDKEMFEDYFEPQFRNILKKVSSKYESIYDVAKDFYGED